MYSFKNDYSEGAHPLLLQALIDNNLENNTGYGLDKHSLLAVEHIQKHLGSTFSKIYFLAGGTQTNLLVSSAFLRPHQAIVSAYTGHINTHEAGAIETTGHKVLAINSPNGKLTPKLIQNTLDEHSDEHMVQPKLVYISNATEIGTIYNKEELSALHHFCKLNNLLLYMDGARIGNALCSADNDLTLECIAKLVDAFYIGGTKNGALNGEALVICNENLCTDFRYIMKQRGALTAKGFVIGSQFETLFKNNLYFELSNHANDMAMVLQEGIKQLKYDFLTISSTNQIFPIFPYSLINILENDFEFYIWQKIDEYSAAIRLVTSWATKPETVHMFLDSIKNITLND